jgi:UDP-N-acetylglucosamine 2-epimerase (non-hydrolysing)
MGEVLDYYMPQIESRPILTKLNLESGRYFLVSAHRQENVDSKARLTNLLRTIKEIRTEWGFPVLVSTHPRTRKQLEGIPGYDETDGVIFHEPFGFLDYVKLQIHATCVLSDSGTVSEESMILGFPAVTIRDSMERPEALDSGGVVMTGLDAGNVLTGVSLAIETKSNDNRTLSLPSGYEVKDCSMRVAKFLLSTISRHHEWAGIRDLG